MRENVPSETALAQGLFIAQVAIAVGFFGYMLFFGGLTTIEKKRVGVIVIFFLCCGAVLGRLRASRPPRSTLFAVDYTDRSWLGSMFPENVHPASWYQSINPTCIIIFAPFFAWIWVALGARNLDPSAPVQVGHGPHVVRRRLPHHDVGGAAGGVERRQGRPDLAAAGLPDPHLRRVVPVAGRTLERHQACAGRSSSSSLMGTWFLGDAPSATRSPAWSAVTSASLDGRRTARTSSSS